MATERKNHRISSFTVSSMSLLITVQCPLSYIAEIKHFPKAVRSAVQLFKLTHHA